MTFEFDDFDTQVGPEEYYSGPTDQELDQMLAEGEWESLPMYPYENEGLDVEELTLIVKGLGFEVINLD